MSQLVSITFDIQDDLGNDVNHISLETLGSIKGLSLLCI